MFIDIIHLFALQHMRSKQDSTALAYSFYDVIAANTQSPRPLREMRRRCLNPGLYAHHLERWLNYYDVSQVCTAITVQVQHRLCYVKVLFCVKSLTYQHGHQCYRDGNWLCGFTEFQSIHSILGSRDAK
jgi:hypothetical protein